MRFGAAAVVVAATIGIAAAQVPVVSTEHGRVSGTVEKSIKGREFYSFYGIPFAQPPVGKLRFKDPEPLSPWEGTREATVPPSECPQHLFAEEVVENAEVQPTGDEDCLYLNVFTPKVKKEKALPVMVWIHGGAFFCGSAEEYPPYVLLDQDIVLVVIQYRLGVLGFLTTEDSVMPGNLGLKDQTMALKWVQRNIHGFGGDRARVTIFGESAGGASVHFQILTPKTEGLISRAILESGSAVCPWAVNNNPRHAALRTAEAVGCPIDQNSEALLACLQEVDAVIFLSVLEDLRDWNFMPVIFSPWVDGDYLPDHPAVLVRDGRHAKIDIISGVTRDDGSFYTITMEQENLLGGLQNNFDVVGPASVQSGGTSDDPVGVARLLYNHYTGTSHVTEDHEYNIMRMLTNRHFAMGHDLTTIFHARNLSPTRKTYRYELQHVAELSITQVLCPTCDDKKMVCHGDDLYYLFAGGSLLTPKKPSLPKDLRRPDDLALRHIMTTMWTNFAATGNPTPDASLGFRWEPSTEDNLHFLSLTPSPSMKPDNRVQIRKFHNSLPTKENLILHPHLVQHEPSDASSSSKTEL